MWSNVFMTLLNPTTTSTCVKAAAGGVTVHALKSELEHIMSLLTDHLSTIIGALRLHVSNVASVATSIYLLATIGNI
jgi:hypothetical protein